MRIALVLLSASLLSVLGCESAPPEPKPRQKNNAAVPAPKSKSTATKDVAAKKADSGPGEVVPAGPGGGDPLQGRFSLEDATSGLDGEGELIAAIETEKGTLGCTLFSDKAPKTVANFVGLARGLRPFRDRGKWVKRPGYDGTTFHRVIPGFMIQGGDPTGSGAGQPGYVIPDEIWKGATHNKKGQLCMANRGPNTNGMQFFITDGAAPHLDGGYTIFGECKPLSVVDAIAKVERRGDRAVKPVRIERVTIRRGS